MSSYQYNLDTALELVYTIGANRKRFYVYSDSSEISVKVCDLFNRATRGTITPIHLAIPYYVPAMQTGDLLIIFSEKSSTELFNLAFECIKNGVTTFSFCGYKDTSLKNVSTFYQMYDTDETDKLKEYFITDITSIAKT